MKVLDLELQIARMYRLIDMATRDQMRRIYRNMLELFESKRNMPTAATVST